MNFDEFLNEAQKPQPSEADIEKAAQMVAAAMVKRTEDPKYDFRGGRTQFRTWVNNFGSTMIKSQFEGPLKSLLDKGITPRKIAKRAKELAIEMFNANDSKGNKKDAVKEQMISEIINRLADQLRDESMTKSEGEKWFAERGENEIDSIIEGMGEDERFSEIEIGGSEILKQVKDAIMKMEDVFE